MSDITLDFQQAKVKHLQFKSNLRSILYGALDIDENPVLSHFECTVGKWIYEYALGHYGHEPEMIALENVHADIHKKANELINLYKSGKVLEARSGLADMEKTAERLVNLLTIIEGKTMAKQDSFKESKNYQSTEKTIKELQNLTKTNEELDKIISKQSLELVHERKYLKDLFAQLPAMIAVLKGKNHSVEMANKHFLNFIQDEEIIGSPVKNKFPEMDGENVDSIVDNVFKSGESYFRKEASFMIKGGTKTNKLFVNISLVPLKSIQGNVEGVIFFSYDITELIKPSEQTSHLREEDISMKNQQLEKEVKKLKRQIQSLKKKSNETKS